MPIKRRLQKGRHLDAYRLEMLRHGPEAMLLAGCGYLAEAGPVGSFATATPEQQAAIIEAMRADWARHGERLRADGGEWWAVRFDSETEHL
jgi:hypothetical protein